MRHLAGQAPAGLEAGMAIAMSAVFCLWRLVRGPLIGALEITAALIVLFEEWGWRPLAALLASLTRFKLWARIELMIASLPPYGALAALAVPTTILFPLKFVALYLLANGQALAAGALFTAAKIASTASIARIFILTKPSLMRIGWFARAHDWFVPWQEAMFALIRSSWIWRYGRTVKSWARHYANQAWARARPVLVKLERWTRDRGRSMWSRVRPKLMVEVMRLKLAARRTWDRLIGT